MTTSNQPIACCPHCGLGATVASGFEPQVVLCDVEVGGCDTYFGVQCRVTFNYDIEVSKLSFSNPAKVQP